MSATIFRARADSTTSSALSSTSWSNPSRLSVTSTLAFVTAAGSMSTRSSAWYDDDDFPELVAVQSVPRWEGPYWSYGERWEEKVGVGREKKKKMTTRGVWRRWKRWARERRERGGD